MNPFRILLPLAAAAALVGAAHAQSADAASDTGAVLLLATAEAFGLAPEQVAAAQRLGAAAPRCASDADGAVCRVRVPAAAAEVCRAAAVAAYVAGETGQPPRAVRYEVACRGGETVNLAVLVHPEDAAAGHRVHVAQVTRTAVTYNEARTTAEIRAAAFPGTPLTPEAVTRREALSAAEAQWRAARAGEPRTLLGALEGWAAATAAVDAADEAVPAREGLERRTAEVMVRIAALDAGGEAGAWTARVAGGRNLGLTSGAAGRVVATPRTGDPRRQRPQAVGTATLDAVGWGRSAVTLNVQPDAAEVREGDLVELRVEVPSAAHRSAWGELAELSVGLLSLHGKPLLHPVQLRLHDSAELEHDLAVAAAYSIRATAERLRMSASPHWSEPLVGGRYRGDSVVGAMARTRPEDVGDFARYLLSAPGRFMGRDWPIAEVYATWLLHGAPESVR